MRRFSLLVTIACLPLGLGAQEPELRFDRLTPGELEPFVQRILDSASKSLEKLLAVRGKRSVENTLRPYDDYRLLINRARVVSLLTDVHPDSAIRAAAVRAESRLTAYQQSRRTDRRIYEMLRQVDTVGLDREVRLWLGRELQNFKLESVDRDSTTRVKAWALQQELDRLQHEWGENPRRDTLSVAFEPAELAGVNPVFIAAHRKDVNGRVLVGANEMRAILMQATNPATRERAVRESLRLRANHFVLDTMLHRRYELATLLGFRNWADYQLRTSMAGSPEGVRRFLDDVRRMTEPALRRAVEERLRSGDASADSVARSISAYDLAAADAGAGGPAAAVGPALRPYLPYDRVRDGMLDLAREFLDLDFRPASDLPVWEPSVEPYRVYQNGKAIAKVYLDLHWRPGRSPQEAYASYFRTGVRDRSIVETALVGGMVTQRSGEPVTLGPRAMETMFHEFGHLLHTLLSVRPWFATSGLPNDFDFREVPSRLFEEWAKDSAVVARFARHYQTGEPAPGELLARLRGPSGRAGGFMGQFTARMSLEVHDRPPDDWHAAIQQAFLQSIPPGFPYTITMPTGDLHPELPLPHLGNGYDAAYYTYLWSDVIAQDLLTRFKRGLLDREAIQAYRKYILEPGRSRSATEMVEAFLGRPYSMDAWARYVNPP